jgi:hypothetical protein
MGALHAGHAALIAAARRTAATVVVSIFVNPRQFANAADVARYPRTLEGDEQLAEAPCVDTRGQQCAGGREQVGRIELTEQAALDGYAHRTDHDIEVQPAPGGGSCFTLRLPRADA